MAKESRADRFQKAADKVSDAQAEFEILKEELEDWLGNMPENLQSSAKADELQEAIDGLEQVIDNCDSAQSADVTFPGMY